MVTNPKVIFIIVCGLLAYGFVGLLSLVYLILQKCDPALIAVIAATTTGAIGNVAGMLNNTRTQAAPAPEPAQPTETRIINTPAEPVPTTERP